MTTTDNYASFTTASDGMPMRGWSERFGRWSEMLSTEMHCKD